ncbi:MAG: choice-of-anchor D domain-containing protein [Kiritimatiellae bacterium]|nr:choice-of-anchor D domain-containing protein [Kiritimatiellia bacterium]MDW8457627.1 choice-of-anchor D domain-containing protein [Verrucomicrobiota bacterium]
MVAGQVVFGQVTYYWRGDSGPADGNNWQVDNNWWRGYTEAPTGSEIIRFDNNHKLITTNNLTATARYRIFFDSLATSARIATGTTVNIFYDFGGNVPKIENNSTSSHALLFPIQAGFNNFEVNPVTGDLELIRLDLQGFNVNVWGTNGRALTIRNLGGSTGTVAIQQNSTVVITESVTNRGTMAILAGALRYNVTTGLDHTNTIFVGADGGSVPARLEVGTSGVVVSNRLHVRSGTGNRTIANLSSGMATFEGEMLLANSVTFSNGAGGTLRFRGPVNFNSAQRLITVPAGHTANIEGRMTNDAGNGLVKAGLGELRIGASNDITGLYIDEGTVRLTGTVAHVRGVIDIGPASGTSNAMLILQDAGLVVTNQIRSRSSSGNRNLLAANTSGTITLSGSNTLDREITYEVAGGGELLVSGVMGGSQTLRKWGDGRLTLTNNNALSGSIVVSGGVLRISHNNALGTTAASTDVRTGATLEVTGNINSPEPLITRGFGVGSNGVIRNISGNNTLSGNITNQITSAIGVDSGTELTLSGVVSSSSTENFIKNGAGTLILAGNNTFTGQLDIQGGVVSVNYIDSSASAAQPLGSRTTSPGIRMGSSVFPSTARGTLRYTGATDTVLPKSIRLTENTEAGIEITANVNLTNSAEIFAGAAANVLIKSGPGRFVMESVNTFAGRLYITQGVVRALGPMSLGNTNDSDNQATFVWPGTGMEAALEVAGGFTLGERIYLAGAGINSGGALRNISGDNTLTGRIFFSSATRISSDAGRLHVSNSTAITSAFGLTLAGAGEVEWNTPLNIGANPLIKDGTGTATVHSINTYSGSTTISNGVLVVRGSSANSAHTIMGVGTLRGTGTVGALTVFGLVDPGNTIGDRANLNSGNLTLQTNGGMRVDISNVSGTPGTEWDQIVVGSGSGSVTVNSTVDNPFVIYLHGNPTGWDSSTNYSWRIVNAGSISGFATNRFVVNTTGFSPSLGGGAFSVTNSGGNLFLVFTSGGLAGDVEVYGNNTLIVNGDTTPSFADHTLFGDVVTDGGTFQRVFTITNSGTAAIGLGGISFSGGHSSDFTVINQPPATLPAGGSTNITIEFDPSADGERWTDLTFTNTVAGKSPYTFRIAGTGVTYNLDVLGNGQVIADGDSTPSTADHTDFGLVGVSGATLTRTFTITNTGNRPLAISNVVIVGTHASDFTVVTQPPTQIAAGATATFQVQFDPSAIGLRTAEVLFTNSSSTGKNPYNFAIQGTGAGSGISNHPGTIAFTSMLGSLPSPSFQSFSVSNIGLETLTYSFATNASWLSVSNTANTAAPGAGNIHTVHVQLIAGLQAGVSNATITVTGDSFTTNSPQTISVTWTITNIPNPSAQSAVADGPQMVRLSWTKHPSFDVLIVYRNGAAPAAPAQGTSYNAGDTIGGSSLVIYKGAGSALEHVVPAGSTNFYAFYSINNNYYSPGVSAGATTPVFQVLITDQASYTNGVSLTGLNGGVGWGGAWGSGGGSWIVTNGSLEVPSGHPGAAANALYVPAPAANVDVTRNRPFGAAYSTGRLYLAYTFRAGAVGTGRYLGLQLTSNGAGRLYYGLRGGQTVLGVEESVSFGGQNSSYVINTGTGDIYTVVGRYDFATREMNILGYFKTTTIPAIEPATWDASYTVPAANAPGSIDGLSINMGGFGGLSLGNTWLDEIRVAQSWGQLWERMTMGVGPTSIVINTFIGGTATSGIFVVTNLGYATLHVTNTVSYGAGLSGWLSISPVTAAVGAAQTRVFTGAVVAAGVTNTGTFIATNTVSANAENSPIRVVYTLNVSNLPPVASASATPDGPQMVRLAWSNHPGLEVMVVHRYNAPPAAPAQGVYYSAGDEIVPGSFVAFRGAATSLEHVVNAASLNYYAIYSANGAFYSTGVLVSAVTPPFRSPVVEQASYTNGMTYLAGLNGGTGWNGAWNLSTWVVTNGSLPVPTRHPGPAANMFRLLPDSTTNAIWTRNIEADYIFNTGTVYLAYTFRTESFGPNRRVGMTIRDFYLGRGVFFGVAPGTYQFGIFAEQTWAGVTSSVSTGTGTGDVYTVVGRYNITSRVASLYAYHWTDTIPLSEPATWHATFTNPVANAPVDIDQLQIYLEGIGGVSVSNTAVDEIFYAPSWDQLWGFGGIGVAPTSIVWNVVWGGSPTASTFVVTNIGRANLFATNTLSYGNGLSGWVSLSHTSMVVYTSSAQVVTASLNMASVTNVGTFVATNRIAGHATNGPVDVVITLNVYPAPPSNLTAVADGPQMVRLNWNNHSNFNVMLVYRNGAAPAAPVQGTAYNPGDTIGGSSLVIYKGPATSLEHVVPALSTNFYALYSVSSNNFYSTAVSASTNTPGFDVLIIDQFSYTNGVPLGLLNGGTGWGGAWSSTSSLAGAYHITNVTLAYPTNHPGGRGNSLFLPAPGTNGTAIRSRPFGYTFSTGRIYLAYTFRLQTVGSLRYAGVHLMSGTNRILYYGVPGGSSHLGVQESITHSGSISTYFVTTGTNDIHTVVGRYNFETREMAILGIYRTGTIPFTEPALWSTNYIVPAAYAPSFIDGFAFSVGAYSGGVQSNAWFDEIRVARNWCQLWAFTGAPAIAVSPTSMSFSAMLGDNVSITQQLTIINTGFTNLIWSISTNYGAGLQNWLAIAPGAGTNPACDQTTINVVLQGGSLTNAGTFVATNVISGNATNGPISVPVTITVSNIPPPSFLSAIPDGPEFIRLAWSSALPVLLVYRQDSAPTADPVNGTSYSIGSTIGGGTVIYTGTLQSLEHAVRTNATHHYRIYAVNNNYYSTPTAASTNTPPYVDSVIVDPFPYTNSVLINYVAQHRGIGFTGNWFAITSTNNFLGHSQSLPAPLNYPTNGANKLWVFDPGVGEVAELYRPFPATSTGRIYVAFLLQMQSNNLLNFAGVHLAQGNTPYLFVGKGGGTTNLRVESIQAGYAGASSAYYVSTGTNNTHAVLGRYDFATRELSVIGVYQSSSIPTGEPITWDATYIVPAVHAPTYIDGIRLISGATNPSGVGHVYFDEVRIAPTYEDLFNLRPPHATNYLVGATNGITDAALRTGSYPVQLWLYSLFGMTNSATNPDYDFLNPLGTIVINDQPFTNFLYSDAGRSLQSSNHVQPAVAYNDVVLGVYTMRWSAATSNGVWRYNHVTLSNGTVQTFVVFDDDTNPPVANTIQSPHSSASHFMHVSSNNNAVGSVGGSSGTNITYILFDHYLANVIAPTSPLTFFFGASDAGSGLSRGVGADPLYHSHLSIGSAIVSNTANWDPVLSTHFTNTTTASTNAWTFTNAFSASVVSALVNNTAFGLGTNPVVLTWRDADDDRPGDQLSHPGQQHGLLVVRDDDTTPPEFSFFGIRGVTGVNTVRVDELQYGFGWWITGRVRDVESGVNVNGTSTNTPNNSPYFQLIDPTGTVRLTKVFDFLQFTDGGALVFTDGTVSNGAVAIPSVTTNDTGIWTARVVVADNDNDWGIHDQLVATNDIPFTVIVGPNLAGLAIAPAIHSVTSTFGVITAPSPWPNTFATNVGNGALIYSLQTVFVGPSGWLTVSPASNIILLGNGAVTSHTYTVDPSMLAPGVYTARVLFVGNQTNGTRTNIVALRVFGYQPGEIVDQFTNSSGSLENMIGGTGWTNAWNNNPDVGFSIDPGNLYVPTNYPAAAGNKACGNTAGTELQAFRYFNPFTTGKIFMAVAVRKTDGNADGFNGISFMSNAAEVAFAGKVFNNANFGIDLGPNGGMKLSSFGVNGVGDPGYFYVGMYDFNSNRFYGFALYGGALPLTEPNWYVTGTPTVAIGMINGIRVAAKDEGNFCFDEIRVASSWPGLLNQFTNEPNVHASGMHFYNVSTTSMTAGWIPGNGAYRIVVARESAPVTFVPTDGVSYASSANFTNAPDFGGNRIIYNGIGTNVHVTGLNPETLYHFAVFEYNMGGTPSPNYYTAPGFATGQQWTLSLEPFGNATNLMAYPDSPYSISNTWTIASGTPAPSGYLLLYGTNPVTALPQDGVGYTNGQLVGGFTAFIATPGTVSNALHTNLLTCTLYHFRIFSFRWNGSAPQTYNYFTSTVVTASAETLCAQPTLQASNIVFQSVGTSRVELCFSPGNGQGRVVVVRGTNAVNQFPVDGTSYTASTNFGSGSHLGDGNFVVSVGTATCVEVVGLAPGVTWHFRVFEYNGAGSGIDYLTVTASNNPRSVATLAQGIIYEGFDYGSFVNLSGLSGGTGWTNAWITTGGLVETGPGNFPQFGNYPPDYPAPTRSGFIDLGNTSEDTSGQRAARRNFAPFTSGKFVMGFKINNNHTLVGTNYLGVNLLNGSAVTAFVGKAYGVEQRRLSIQYGSQIRTNRLDGTNPGYEINAGVDYLIVLEYDFEQDTLKARAYTTNQLMHAVPEKEAAWIVEMTNVVIEKIDGIQLVASDNNQIVTFDSIRITPSWEETTWGVPQGWHDDYGPLPALVYIGTNYGPSVYNLVVTNLSDAELASTNLIDFAVRWEARLGGLFLTNTVATNLNIGSHQARVNPNWDPLAIGAATNPFNLDKVFEGYIGYNGFASVTTFHKAAFNVTNLDFTVNYFVTVSGENAPAGAPTVPAALGPSWAVVPTNRAMTINWPLQFYAYDDDTNAPLLGAKPLRVFTNSLIAPAQTVGSLDRYFIEDGVLTGAGMRVMVNIYDQHSGLQRSPHGPASTNATLSIPFVATNNFADYEASWSSAIGTNANATSTWSFAASLFTWQRVSDMWGGDGSGAQGQDLAVTVTMPDNDADRVNDQMIASNLLAGYIRLIDDDTDGPLMADIIYTGSVARPFFILTNLFPLGSGDTEIRGTYPRREGTSTNSTFAVTDEELALSGSKGLQFAFGAMDLGSGIRRATSGGTNDGINFEIRLTTPIVTNTIIGWNASLSTSNNAPGVVQTNIFSFTNGFFTESQINQLINNTLFTMAKRSLVRVNLQDSDNDRTNDVSINAALSYGWIRVYDDDVKGPSMTSLQVDNSFSDEAVLFTSFETSEGWPAFLASGTLWTNVVTNGLGTGVWFGTTYVNLGDAAGGVRKGGFAATGVGQYLQTPARTDVGKVMVDARLSSTGAVRHLELLFWDGTNWASAGTNEVDSADYQSEVWNIDWPGITTLRLVRVGTDGSPGIYIDNFIVLQSGFLADTNSLGWTNLTSVTIRWDHATDDYHGIDEYRIVAPAIGTTPPTATNHGFNVPGNQTSQVVSLLHQQGTITGFIFAIDNDLDRPSASSQDRAMGSVVAFRLRIDTNPPLPVANATNVTDDPLVDETTEIKVQWTPGHTNSHIAAGWRTSDNTPLSPWDTYIITVHELDGSFNPISTTVITKAQIPNLGSNNTSSIIISNLNFDALHRVRIRARDAAGNLSPEVVVTGLTVNFQVTQGISRVFSPGTNGVRLAWIASTNRVYDELFVDALNFSDSLSNAWKWLDRITNNVAGGNMLIDEGGFSPTNHYRVPPEELGATMRFYRVSLQDAWQPTNALRRGSREVYVTKPIRLVPGENWYGTFFVPDTATVAYVFGTNRVPAGTTYATATKIHWFSPQRGTGSYNFVTNTVGLYGGSSGGTWLRWTGDWGAVANDMVFPTHQGFMIELPVGSPTIHLPIVGRVMTQQQVIAIQGASGSGSNLFHVLNWNYPIHVSLTGALFRGSGMVGHNFVAFADEIRILSVSNGIASLTHPRVRWHLRSDGTTWNLAAYNTNEFSSPPTVANFRIRPDDVVIIIRRNPGMMYWTNRLYYSIPGKNFNP